MIDCVHWHESAITLEAGQCDAGEGGGKPTAGFCRLICSKRVSEPGKVAAYMGRHKADLTAVSRVLLPPQNVPVDHDPAKAVEGDCGC